MIRLHEMPFQKLKWLLFILYTIDQRILNQVQDDSVKSRTSQGRMALHPPFSWREKAQDEGEDVPAITLSRAKTYTDGRSVHSNSGFRARASVATPAVSASQETPSPSHRSAHAVISITAGVRSRPFSVS